MRIAGRRFSAALALAVLAGSSLGVHAGDDPLAPGAAPRFAAVTVFPAAAHGSAPEHFDGGDGVTRPPCFACLVSLQSVAGFAGAARVLPAAPVPTACLAASWRVPRALRVGPGGGRAPPLA